MKNTEYLEEICRVKLGRGERPTDIKRPATGKFNESLFFSLAGKDYVFRMAPPDDAGFLFYEKNMMAQEPSLHKIIREKTDIPVARILVYDDSREIAPRPYLIMEKLAGAPLSYTTRFGLSKVLRQVGQYLKQLHSITAQSYGYLGEHKVMIPADSWVEAFEIMWNKLLDDIVGCGGYTKEEADRFRRLFDKDRDIFDRPVKSSLLHMDIWHQNILADEEGRVTGIVDWDRALWGDVEIEFAVLDYCGISEEAFWDGYGRVRDNSPIVKRRWLYYYLYELQKYIVIRTLRTQDLAQARAYRDNAIEMSVALE
ncbi:MAG: aminoglycoside phosphotransferase family protein [Sedimentisphaerales bacterium]|nr:aminoglycoside phosphotransferase family protein [Sedimentisphaerales bacterium]